MSGTAIRIKINDQDISQLLGRIQQNMGNLLPAMKTIGGVIRSSVIMNFEAGGRPEKWTQHSETTKKRRGDGAPILRKQGIAGGLMGSIHVTAEQNQVAVGTNKEYAAVHQFGAKKGSFGTVASMVRSHLRKSRKGNQYRVGSHWRRARLPWGDIPARPFLVVQAEDMVEIRDVLNDFIMGG